MALAIQTTPEKLVTTYLEMRDQAQFLPAYSQANDVEIVSLESSDVAFYRFLYQSVGAEWCWRDRLLLSDDELEAILSAPTTGVHVLYVSGAPAGYVEISQEGESGEIAYFGLRRPYFGRGLGKHLLSHGIEQAWKMAGVERVWLHTCNLDGPHALANYMKRGFSIFKVEEEAMPDLYKGTEEIAA